MITFADVVGDDTAGTGNGDLGGYVEDEDNLDQTLPVLVGTNWTNSSWLYDNAKSYRRATVRDNARLYNEAYVKDRFDACDDAIMRDCSIGMDRGEIRNSAEMSGESEIRNRGKLIGSGKMFDNAILGGSQILAHGFINRNTLLDGT